MQARPMTCAAKGATRVVAFGSNLFGQLHPDPNVSFRGTEGFYLDDAVTVVAVCTYQTVFRTSSGDLKAIGESTQLLRGLLSELAATNDADIVFVGQDVFELVLDVSSGKCHFVDYAEGCLRSLAYGDNLWKAAAADGRGRCMALDAEGDAYLFASASALWRATESSAGAEALRKAARFVARRYCDGAAEAASSHRLPRFVKVAAGSAHFIILSEQGADSPSEVPVWVYGDARFGAVPLHPDPGTTVGMMSTQIAAPASVAVTEGRFLLGMATFSRAEGFPCRIRDVAAGGRHTLVLSEQGDAYGWGWNEEANLVPYLPSQPGQTETPAWEHNMVSEPTLLLSDAEASVTKLTASKGRTLAITAEGTVLVAGSNEFEALGLAPALPRMQRKPRRERSFSQIIPPFECVNGLQSHPHIANPSGPTEGRVGTVVDVHATALATLITLRTAREDKRE